MSCLIFSVAFLLGLSVGGNSEEVRCYCNLPSCSANNDTCVFQGGGCFSDFLDYRNTSQARHGCLHLLARERMDECGNSPGSTGAPRSLLLCCKADMCNSLLSPNSNLSHSIIGSLINATDPQLTGAPPTRSGYHHNPNEVWFKAATIAVPICGAMILLMLVALAFKILRSDHVTVEKYRKDANCNANTFKANELNAKDFSKQVPLLYETRHEDFRSFTTHRIHYGQNVNVLKEASQSKTEKNLENAKWNSERPRVEECPEGASNSEELDNEPLDVRVHQPPAMPTLSLNLEKIENLSVCNMYTSPAPSDSRLLESSAFDKTYDKYLL